MRRYLLLLFTGLAWGQGDTSWTQTFGGSEYDDAYSVQSTSDGGFILTGHTYSYGNGSSDIWLIKTDSLGNQEWSQTKGGSHSEIGHSVQQTTDGGYIITGYTYSYSAGQRDIWLIKTTESGYTQWTQTFGGSSTDSGHCVKETTDGGYIITGITSSYGNGFSDVWLIKTDSQGQEEWNQTFGGSSDDHGFSVQQTEDGGYIITGKTRSYANGFSDVWLIKTDSQGQEEWNQTFGGSIWDYGYSVQQTEDGGYIITGQIQSFGSGDYDVYLIKTDSNGMEEWNQTFGGENWDIGYSVQQTEDSGYVITGFTESFGNGSMDILLIKTDSLGNLEWNKIFGGYSDDISRSVQVVNNTRFVIAGNTYSFGNEGSDVWLISTTQGSLTPYLIYDIADLEIVEDSSSIFEIYPHHDYNFPIDLSVFENTNNINIQLDSNIINLIPNPNWYGSAQISIVLTDSLSHSDTNHFNLLVTPVNDSPEPFNILYPTASDTFSSHIDSNTDIGFIWEDCNDVDNDVTYRLTIELEFFGNTYTDVYDDMNDTTISIPANNLDALLGGLNMPETALSWFVDAYDGGYNVTSDTGQFVLSRSLLGTVDKSQIPSTFALHQNYPNPFNPTTTLRYDLSANIQVNITIYDMMGRVVKTMVNRQQNAGFKSIQWDATNNQGQPVSAGVYLYSIDAGDFRQTKKMILLK